MNTLSFLAESALLGVGLAMDAFCVSVANSLANPDMKRGKMHGMAFSFGFFQAVMPLTGYFLVTTLLHLFNSLSAYLPWITLSVLWFLGMRMILEGTAKKREDVQVVLSFSALMIQSVATSLDALSAGLTFTPYSLMQVFVSCAVIGVITYAICLTGLKIGKVSAAKISKYAAVAGGCILIFIGAWSFLA